MRNAPSTCLNMQDIVGANCGCGAKAPDSLSADEEEKSCSICGEKLAERTYYGGATISICPNCS